MANDDESDQRGRVFQHQLDELCDRYERELQRGDAPDLLTILSPFQADHRQVAFEQLFVLLVDYSKRGLVPCDVAAILEVFPEYASIIRELIASDASPSPAASGYEKTIDSKPAVPRQTATDPDNNHSDSAHEQTLAGSDVTVGDFRSSSRRIRYFGDYELVDEIARGGMGIVYRAIQKSLNRPVALKMILSGELAGRDEITRFRSEAEAAANLDHPNIVPIFEIGQHEDQHYFSMGLVDGPSLSDRLREGPLDASEACRIVARVAKAIDYAHSKGVIHRDLKPGNILIDADGEPHITDFGLAKQLHGAAELTTTGQVIGTPAYMPPEQARGDLTGIGPTSDIYSLGAILYATLSGRPPHSAGSAVETLRQVIEVEPLGVRSLNPSIAKDLETLCSRCLAKEPRQRFSTAGELADELNRFLRGEPIQSRPVSTLERSWRWAKRHPSMASLSSAVVLLTSTLAIAGPLAAVRQSQLRRDAQHNEQRAMASERKSIENERRATEMAMNEAKARDAIERSRVELAAEKDRSDRALYARTISLAYGQWQDGNLRVAEDTLAAIPAAQRDFEWHYVNSLCHQHQRALVGLKSVPRFVTSVFGTDVIIAAGSNSSFARDAAIYLWRSANDQPTEVRNVLGLAHSRDGKRLVVIAPDNPERFQVMDTLSGDVVCTSDGHPGGTIYADFGGPDESQVVTVGRDKSVKVWSATDGMLQVTLNTPQRHRLSPAALSPDGTLVAWRRSDDGVIEIRQLKKRSVDDKAPPDATTQPVFESARAKRLENWEACLAFSPDGKLLAVGGHGETELIRTSDFGPAGRFDGYRGRTHAIAFSSDGSRIAVASTEAKVRLYDVIRRRPLTSLTGHGVGVVYGITGVAFDESGDHVITGGADTVVKVWDAWNGDQHNRAEVTWPAEPPEPSQAIDYLTKFASVVETVKLSRDGNQLIAAGADRTVRIIDLTDNSIVKEWTNLEQPMAAVDWHPATNRIVAGSGGINSKDPGFVVAWDVDTREEKWRFTEANGPIRELAHTPDGKLIAIAVGSQTVSVGHVWVLDAANGLPVWNNKVAVASQRDLAMSPDGSWFATVGSGGVFLWQTGTGEVRNIDGDRNFVSVAMSSDGRRIAVGSLDWSVRVYDVETGNEVWSTLSHHGAVTSVAFTASDRRVVSTSVDATTRIFDAAFGDMILTMNEAADENLSLAATADGSVIAVSGIGPFIQLRRTDAALINSRDALDASVATSSLDKNAWKIHFADGFNRAELGDDWNTYSGEWAINEGVAIGRLRPSSFSASVFSALLVCNRLVPHDHEVSFDVTVDQPMMVETKISDRTHQNAIGTIFIGAPMSMFNYGEKGGMIYRTVSGAFSQEASRRDNLFQFTPGRTYRLATRRENSTLSMSIDGEVYRSANVPFDVPIPFVNIQSIFGPIDGKISIDNVEVRVPPDSDVPCHAMELVQGLFDTHEIKPLVMAAIDPVEWDESKDKDAIAQEMNRLIELWPQSDEMLVARAEVLSTSDKHASRQPLVAKDFQYLHDWLVNRIRSKTDTVWRTAAACAWRAGDVQAADEARRESQTLHQWRHGCPHPIDVALQVLSSAQRGDVNESGQSMRLLGQLALARHWNDDSSISYWVDQASSAIDASTMPADASEVSRDDADALIQLTWDMQSALMLDGSTELFAKLLADDAVRMDRRSPDDPRPLVVDREPWLDSEIVQCMAGPISGNRLTRTDVLVSGSSSQPLVTSEFVFELPSGHFRWMQLDEFRRGSDELPFRLIKQTVQVLYMFYRGKEFNVQRDGWIALDASVQIAREKKDKSLEIDALSFAGRRQEAYEACEAYANEVNTAGAFVRLAESARDIHRGDWMRAAATRAIELDPMIVGPPYIRALATQQSMTDEHHAFPQGLQVKVPKFYRPSQIELLGSASGIVVWQPTPDSLVGILTIPRPETNDGTNGFEKTVDDLRANRESAMSLTTVRQRRFSVDGHPAAEFVQRGNGIGRAMQAAGQGQATLQRFVLIERSDDILTLLVSAYENEFVNRDSEFEQVLRTLELSDH